MEYTKATLGRIFLLKFSDGDILLKELDRFCRAERVKAGVFVFLGALRKGHLVTGPKKPVIPPEPNWKLFKDGWETLGLGTVFANKQKAPQLHIHTAMGRNNKTMAGCVRRDSSVFLVIEAVMFELKGVKASKDLDPRTGLNLLRMYARHA